MADDLPQTRLIPRTAPLEGSNTVTDFDANGSPPAEMSAAESHYARIGGAPSVKAAVRLFYDRVLDDPDLAGYFEKVEMEEQRRHMVLMLTTVLGGPDSYTGRPLAEAHQPLNIPAAHYVKVGGHLDATLGELGVPADIRADVQTVLGQVQDQVVASGI